MTPDRHRTFATLLLQVAEAESTAELRAQLHAVSEYHAAAAQSGVNRALACLDPRNALCEACAAPLPGPAQICPDCTSPFFLKITP